MKKRFLAFIMVIAMLVSVGIPSHQVDAAGASVSWRVGSETQIFTIYNGTGDDIWYNVYDLYNAANDMYDVGPIASGDSVQITRDKNSYILVEAYDYYGQIVGEAISSGEHGYNVYYSLNGKNVLVENGVLQQGDSFEFIAEDFFVADDGTEWVLNSSESQVIAYGTENYTFSFKPYTPDPVTATVYFVDEYGNVLKKQSKSIEYDFGKGAVTFDIPDSVTVNNREYAIDDTITDSLTIGYLDGVLEYEIGYRSVNPIEEGPYTVTVEYWELDSEGKAVAFLGNTYFAHDTNAENDYVFNAPSTLRILNQEAGTETYYKVITNETITHTPDGQERLYTVGYQKYAENEPYDWSVRLVDAETGVILKEELYTIGAGETEIYEVAPEFEIEGVTYLLDSKMSNEYTHTYNQSSRILNVYYHQETAQLPGSYPVVVQYFDVTNEEMLYSAETIATAEAGGADIVSPATYEAGGKEYVRLGGQVDVMNHDFYSNQRTYTIYYRDVNDNENADVVVIQEEVVTTEKLVYEGFEEDRRTEVNTILSDNEGDVRETRNEEGVRVEDEEVPLANVDGDESVLSKDGETPLSKGLLATAASNPIMSVGLIGGLALIAFLFFLLSKKRKENQAE